jgi:RNase P/RNase MRP subunit POP5
LLPISKDTRTWFSYSTKDTAALSLLTKAIGSLQAGVGANANRKVTVAVSSLQKLKPPQASTVGAVTFEVEKGLFAVSTKAPEPATSEYKETSDGILQVPQKGLRLIMVALLCIGPVYRVGRASQLWCSLSRH